MLKSEVCEEGKQFLPERHHAAAICCKESENYSISSTEQIADKLKRKNSIFSHLRRQREQNPSEIHFIPNDDFSAK
jgi:hypothetical protein